MSSYQLSLASNFPTDCRIPHLENNLYIYGKVPRLQPRPLNYSSNYFSHESNPDKHYSRSPNANSGPYTHLPTGSQFHEQPHQKNSQEKYIEAYKRQPHPFSPYASNPSYQREQFENFDLHHSPLRSSRSNNYQPANPENFKSSAGLSSSEFNEFQLHQEEEKRLKFYREQEIMRLREIERENLELEEFWNIKKREQERKEREDQEFESFILRKQQIEAQIKQDEHLRLQQFQDTQRNRQSKLEQIELEAALNVKRHEEMARVEYEKTMEMRRREELSRLQMEAIQNPRHEKQRMMKKVTINEDHEVRRKGNKDQFEQKCNTERGGVNLNSKNKKKYQKSASRQVINERKMRVNEESGRERRQFLRDDERKNGERGSMRQILSLKLRDEDKKQHQSDLSFKERGSSSKSDNRKSRSVSAQKHEPHYHKPTFSTKVKAMGNQSYRFVGHKK